MQNVEQACSVAEAIRARKSVRAFRPDPVSPALIREVLELARYSPSWSNTQPWEVAVATDQALATLKDAISEKHDARVPDNPDLPFPTNPPIYHQRSRENGLGLFGLLGIKREDVDKKHAYVRVVSRFFEAPVGMVFYLEKGLSPWSIFDLGAFAQTVMLAAAGRGLGTCPLAAIIRYPDVVREVLGIPATKMLICGMGLGYEDRDAEINTHRSPRITVDEFVHWCAG